MDENHQPLTITVEELGAARRVIVGGEIDLDTSSTLQSALDELIDAGVELVVLDLTHVEFVDSTGLRVIVSTGNRLTDSGRRLVIDGLSPAARRILEVTGLLEAYREE